MTETRPTRYLIARALVHAGLLVGGVMLIASTLGYKVALGLALLFVYVKGD